MEIIRRCDHRLLRSTYVKKISKFSKIVTPVSWYEHKLCTDKSCQLPGKPERILPVWASSILPPSTLLEPPSDNMPLMSLYIAWCWIIIAEGIRRAHVWKVKPRRNLKERTMVKWQQRWVYRIEWWSNSVKGTMISPAGNYQHFFTPGGECVVGGRMHWHNSPSGDLIQRQNVARLSRERFVRQKLSDLLVNETYRSPQVPFRAKLFRFQHVPSYRLYIYIYHGMVRPAVQPGNNSCFEANCNIF